MIGVSGTPLKILFSEGSSLSAREALSSLGELGYELHICDPNPLCICRFSRYAAKFFKCPPIGKEPAAYLDFIQQRLAQERYDVLLPVHEQAFLFSKMQDQLKKHTGLAVAAFDSFQKLQSKVQFLRLLDSLNIPHPLTYYYKEAQELEQKLFYPCYLKTDYGTGSSGVWKLNSSEDLGQALRELGQRAIFNGRDEVMVQEVAGGTMEIVYTCFNQGELIALHCNRRLAEGAKGSSSSKLGVDRPIVKEHLQILGRHLNWHGSLAIDYIYDDAAGIPYYIDASPRLVEPMGATINGMNIPELVVRLSLNQPVKASLGATHGKKTHMLMLALLGMCDNGASRRDVLRELVRAIRKKGVYSGSIEELLNVKKDVFSLFPFLIVLGQLLINPRSSQRISTSTVNNYALSRTSIEIIKTL